MLKRVLIFLAVIVLCSMQIAVAIAAEDSARTNSSGLNYQSAFSCGDNSKFNWYCDDSNQPQPKKAVTQKDQEQAAVDKMDELNKELKAKRDLAILEPTPEHVKDYIETQEVVMNMASTFSDTWRRVIWQNPDVNYELKRPANNAAIKTYNDLLKTNQIQTVADFNKEGWGLFFFFRSDCPYCHRMAPMLKMFSDTYGMTILPISEDGGGLPEYPHPQVDKSGVAAQLGLDVVPALVLGNIKDHRMIPIASGMISAEDILQRIYVLTQTKPGESY
ncbi:MAG: conjugal transfer protein TraF [Burkholderiales bacterium]